MFVWLQFGNFIRGWSLYSEATEMQKAQTQSFNLDLQAYNAVLYCLPAVFSTDATSKKLWNAARVRPLHSLSLRSTFTISWAIYRVLAARFGQILRHIFCTCTCTVHIRVLLSIERVGADGGEAGGARRAHVRPPLPHPALRARRRAARALAARYPPRNGAPTHQYARSLLANSALLVVFAFQRALNNTCTVLAVSS